MESLQGSFQPPVEWNYREKYVLFLVSSFQACEGIGPFAGAWLTANPIRQYTPQELGYMGALGQALNAILLPFLGKFADWTHRKRLLVLSGSLLNFISGIATVFLPQFYWLQMFMQVPMALGPLMGMGMNAITLGATHDSNFAQQIAFNTIGGQIGGTVSTLFIAACSLWLPKIQNKQDPDGPETSAPWWCIVPLVSCIIGGFSTYLIRNDKINMRRAAGHTVKQTGSTAHEEVSDWAGIKILLKKMAFWHLLVLVFTFNIANMAILQILIQQGSSLIPDEALAFTSAAQIINHVGSTVMAVVAPVLVVKLGVKPLLIIVPMMVTTRALLTALIENLVVQQGGSIWWMLIVCQIFDGFGMGAWGIVILLVVQDIADGTGCFNFAMGLQQAFFSGGAVISSIMAGDLATRVSFSAAYLAMAAAGAVTVLQALCFPKIVRSGNVSDSMIEKLHSSHHDHDNADRSL